jgi:hypothetical protein
MNRPLRAPIAHPTHFSAEDLDRRLHQRIGQRLLGPTLRLRRRRVLRTPAGNGPIST